MIKLDRFCALPEDKVVKAVIGAWRELALGLMDQERHTLKVDLTTEEMLAFLFVSVYMENMSKGGTVDDFKKGVVARMNEVEKRS